MAPTLPPEALKNDHYPVSCSRCTVVLLERSSVVFGPPINNGMVHRRDLCADCWLAFLDWLDE